MPSLQNFAASMAPRLRDVGLGQLDALCQVLAWSRSATDRANDLFEFMTEPWGAWPLGDRPPWANDITDDGTPYEFSIAFSGGEPRLRLLVASQRLPPTETSSWEAALALSRSLGMFGADVSRFQLVKDLFAPTSMGGASFYLWHAAVIDPSGNHLFKAYLNPEVLGIASAAPLVGQALRRLDLGDAWPFLSERLTDPALPGTLRFFALDLESSHTARVKVYVGYSGRANDIARQLDGCAHVNPGDAQQWLDTLACSSGPYEGRPILACYAFRADGSAPEVTLHTPIRHHVSHDREALDRVKLLLGDADRSRLEEAVTALARRPLEGGRGLITYASVRPSSTTLNVTTYLAPELYSITPQRRASQTMRRTTRSASHPAGGELRTLGDIQDLVGRQRLLLAEHPFLERLTGVVSIDDLKRIVQRFAFFTMGFQDVLRLAANLTSDPRLADMARTHAIEDAGHEQWYLDDLKLLGLEVDVGWLYSEAHAATRDVTYKVTAEIIRSQHDLTRLATVLSLEAGADEFFSRMVGLLERSGLLVGLKYFASPHQEAESEHEMSNLDLRLELTPVDGLPTREEVRGAIERTFCAMRELASDIENALQ